MPEAAGKTEVVDCGVDLERFGPLDACPKVRARAFVCVGSLIERKNVVRLADAFARLGEGHADVRRRRAAPAAARGPAGVTITGYVPHDARARLSRGRRRPLPAEPRRALRPGGARGAGLRRAAWSRRVSAGRRSSFRPVPACWSTRQTRRRSSRRCGRPPPSRSRTRRRARRPRRTTSGVRRLGWRRFSSEPFEVGEPDLDERPDRVLDPRLAGELERLLVALPRLLGRRRPA